MVLYIIPACQKRKKRGQLPAFSLRVNVCLWEVSLTNLIPSLQSSEKNVSIVTLAQFVKIHTHTYIIYLYTRKALVLEFKKEIQHLISNSILTWYRVDLFYWHVERFI